MGEILDDYRRRGQVPSTLQQSDSNIFRLFGDVYSKTYEAGALSPKVKELIALAMGLVRTCDDCTIYHLSQLRDLEASRREIHETLALVLIVGGSALIPSIRRADLVWSELDADRATSADALPDTGPADASLTRASPTASG